MFDFVEYVTVNLGGSFEVRRYSQFQYLIQIVVAPMEVNFIIEVYSGSLLTHVCNKFARFDENFALYHIDEGQTFLIWHMTGWNPFSHRVGSWRLSWERLELLQLLFSCEKVCLEAFSLGLSQALISAPIRLGLRKNLNPVPEYLMVLYLFRIASRSFRNLAIKDERILFSKNRNMGILIDVVDDWAAQYQTCPWLVTAMIRNRSLDSRQSDNESTPFPYANCVASSFILDNFGVEISQELFIRKFSVALSDSLSSVSDSLSSSKSGSHYSSLSLSCESLDCQRLHDCFNHSFSSSGIFESISEFKSVRLIAFRPHPLGEDNIIALLEDVVEDIEQDSNFFVVVDTFSLLSWLSETEPFPKEFTVSMASKARTSGNTISSIDIDMKDSINIRIPLFNMKEWKELCKKYEYSVINNELKWNIQSYFDGLLQPHVVSEDCNPNNSGSTLSSSTNSSSTNSNNNGFELESVNSSPSVPSSSDSVLQYSNSLSNSACESDTIIDDQDVEEGTDKLNWKEQWIALFRKLSDLDYLVSGQEQNVRGLFSQFSILSRKLEMKSVI